VTRQYDPPMTARTAASANTKAQRIHQAVKWTVYTLLLINFVFYFLEDWNRAQHTLHAGSTFLDWTSEFATTIDETGWLLLIFMFELETYVLEDKQWTGWVSHTVRGIRLFCYAMIAHSVFAFLVVVIDLQPTVVVENASSLCDVVSDDVSYVYNLEYTEVDEQNCSELSDASRFFWLGKDPLVVSGDGLELERDLAWADLIEVVVWLLILLAIEVVVRLQDRGVTGGALLSAANRLKFFLYLVLTGLAIYWATLSHWLYFWDELVWIAGFAAIERNVRAWRNELLMNQEAT
jgi:hypothetical protein